ncbi:hypothetical protein BC936DRAFT_144307 [Jimgerdemannia flammicorona]|uniref:Uncharacterized protein n=1 Tax=Jimgerdemannia flammicorona TaxID=994334 RepID=A0A432ZYF5_9FUNG|nr:hypothetical protein BC936DRAFT_144307 [Jimgerdemannia flammicorona]
MKGWATAVKSALQPSTWDAFRVHFIWLLGRIARWTAINVCIVSFPHKEKTEAKRAPNSTEKYTV